MFLEDLQAQQLTPIVSLDILHLCRKGRQTLDEPKGGVAEVLGLMGSSPLLLFRFLEWQQSQQQGRGFSLTSFLLKEGPDKYWIPLIKKMGGMFKGQLNSRALLSCLRQFTLDHLPDAFSSQLDPRHFKRSGFVPFQSRLPHLLEQAINEAAALKGTQQLSDNIDDLHRETVRKCRRHLESGMVDLFSGLITRIEREAHQSLGKRGVALFLDDTISKVSFLSLLGLARGGRGDHLHLLNLHAMACAQVALDLASQLHQMHPTLRGLSSPEDLYVMGLIHDLGHALLLTHFPEIHAQVWDTLQAQEEARTHNPLNFSKHYHEIESEIIHQHQYEKCHQLIQALPKPQRQLCLESIIKESPELASTRHSQGAISAFIDQYLKSFYDPQYAGIQKLWKRLDLPTLTPLEGSNELAQHLLTSSTKGQELVKGAYDNYAKFVRAYGAHQQKETSISVLFIRLCNDMTTQMSQMLGFRYPCAYANIGRAEPFCDQERLAKRMGIEAEDLQQHIESVLQKKCDQWRQQHPHHGKEQIYPLLQPQQLQNDLQLDMADFFKQSQNFSSGMIRFNILHQNIHQVFKDHQSLSPQIFVSELEKSLRHFFRIMEVIVKPRQNLKVQSPDQHFAVLFETEDFAEGMACYHHRHLIADIYLLDPDPKKVSSPDIAVFMKLFCYNLMLNFSSEIWELFKSEKEVARMDIARHIVRQYRLGEGLPCELLYLKARLLDGLLQRFSHEREPHHILRLQFAVYHSHHANLPIEIFPTTDFDYWKQQAGDQAPEYERHSQELTQFIVQHLNELVQGLESHQVFHPFELHLKNASETIPVLVLSLFEMDQQHHSQFLLIMVGATLKRDGALIESLLDKGTPQELARHHSDISTPIGLTLLKYFASDESSSSLSRLTHLRPSRLKEMGFLIHQVQREIQHFVDRLPNPMDVELKEWLSEAKRFWAEHHSDLSKGNKLSTLAIRHFDQFRKHSDLYKKKLRVRSSDFTQLLQSLPCETFGKLRLADPLLCIPWGLDHLYLSYNGFLKFRDSVDKKINHGHPHLRTAAELLHRIESAWFIGHEEHLRRAFISYFEELSREEHIMQSKGPVSCTLTLFLYEQDLPSLPNSPFPHLALECFTPSSTQEGGLQRMVGSAGGGYNTIFRDDFLEFCSIAHRNVIEQSGGQKVMECFFRQHNETPSVRYVDPHMLKYRFLNTSGVSTLFFFPCKAQHIGRQQHHGF